MNKIFLETERVILTEITENDGHFLLDLDSDPEVMKHLTDGRPSNQQEIDSAMERLMKLVKKHQYQFGFWLAFEKESQEFMGWFHFRPEKKNPDDVRNIELGYRLKRKFWGKGLATEVSEALIDFGFSHYDIDSVFAITMKANTGSQNVMKKLGMKWICDYQETDFPGADKSAVRFQLLRNDWEHLESRKKT